MMYFPPAMLPGKGTGPTLLGTPDPPLPPPPPCFVCGAVMVPVAGPVIDHRFCRYRCAGCDIMESGGSVSSPVEGRPETHIDHGLVHAPCP